MPSLPLESDSRIASTAEVEYQVGMPQEHDEWVKDGIKSAGITGFLMPQFSSTQFGCVYASCMLCDVP